MRGTKAEGRASAASGPESGSRFPSDVDVGCLVVLTDPSFPLLSSHTARGVCVIY